MTNFHPNIREIHPAHAPPRLGESVVYALTRRMNPKLSWGPIKTLVLGLISGGVIPLIVLQKRLRDFIVAERTHLWHFAEWFRLEHPSPETEKFQQAVSTLRFRMSLWIISLIFTALGILWACSAISKANLPPIAPQFVSSIGARLPQIIQDLATLPRMLLAAAGLLLVAAHLMSLWQVVAHTGDMQRIVGVYNVAARKHGLDELTPPTLRREFGPIWLITALAAALLGSLWGVPMVLAACAQAGYINGTGRNLRLTLSARVFNTLAARRPALEVMMPGPLRGACVRKDCAAPLRAGAGFCPRCGERAMARI